MDNLARNVLLKWCGGLVSWLFGGRFKSDCLLLGSGTIGMWGMALRNIVKKLVHFKICQIVK